MDRVFFVSQGNFLPTNFQTQNVKNVTQENGRPKPAPLLPPIVKIVSKADGRPKPAPLLPPIVHRVNLVNLKQISGVSNAKIVYEVNMHWRPEVKHAKTVAEVNTKIEMDRAVATKSSLGIAALKLMVLRTNRNAQQGEQAVVAVNFVVTVQMEHTTTLRVKQVVSTAQVVLVKAIEDNRLVLSAVPVNSTMLLVLLSANRVLKTRITAAKEETAVASIAPMDGRPTVKAVRSVLSVALEHLVLVVQIAPLVTPETVPRMRQSADNVKKAKQQQNKAKPPAVGVI